jgi:hypothetical protein
MRLRSILILLLAAATALSVFGYNLWLYSCGACTIRSLLTPSVPGYLLIGLNVLLALVWVWLKQLQRIRDKRRCCPCGSQLLPAWRHCPDCGRECPA